VVKRSKIARDIERERQSEKRNDKQTTQETELTRDTALARDRAKEMGGATLGTGERGVEGMSQLRKLPHHTRRIKDPL